MLSTISSTIFLTDQRYKGIGSFTLPNTSIHALAISNDGELLASGGRSYIKICGKPTEDMLGTGGI